MRIHISESFAQRYTDFALWLCMTLLLSSCSTGTMDLSIADTPVDDADNVYIEISGIEVQPSSGSLTTITFDSPKRIDLLTQTGGDSTALFSGQSLNAGDYKSVKLLVNAQADVRDSYIIVDGNEYELSIPDDALAGLETDQDFSVPRGGSISFTIDFDLRSSLHEPETEGGDYILRPVLRLVDNDSDGALSGTVDPAVIAGLCGVDDKAAVYVFDTGVVTPDDVDGIDPDPVASAIVPLDGVHAYTVAFLTEGAYTVALTCDAAGDRTDADDAGVEFAGTTEVQISAGLTTVQNFLP